MKRIRHAVIGLGFFGEMHVKTLCSMPQVELAAVCTRRGGRLTEIARRFGVSKTYTDYKQLLAEADIDSLSITTHVYHHRDIAVAALASGKHVFLEKPMADTVLSCDAILEAAEGAEGLFMVGHICRFDPRFALAKKAIDEGGIGRIVSMYARRNLPASIGAQVLDKISPLMGDGIHDTDLMLWMTGSRIETVYARTVRVGDFKYPDIGWAMYRFASGAVGVVETVWALPENTPYTIDSQMEIIGTEGAIYIDCGNTGLTIHDRAGAHKPDTAYWPKLQGKVVGVLRTELGYFFDCVASGKTPRVITPAESRTAVAVMCAAEESAATGQIVRMK